MSISLIVNAEIERYLAGSSCRNLFPLFVCRERPDHSSLAFVESGKVRGTVVAGADSGVFTVSNPWLVADDATVARALLLQFGEKSSVNGLQFAWEYRLIAAQLFADMNLSRDLYLSRPAGAGSTCATKNRFVRINDRVLDRVDVPDELRRAIGDLSDFPVDAPFWGLIVDNRLSAIAETMLRVQNCVSIQQVYTIEGVRRQGLARELISCILRDPSLAGATVTWLGSAANIPSINLAERLDFTDFCEFGFLEAPE